MAAKPLGGAGVGQGRGVAGHRRQQELPLAGQGGVEGGVLVAAVRVDAQRDGLQGGGGAAGRLFYRYFGRQIYY